MRVTEERLEEGFYKAALFLKDMMEKHGWVWTSNFLREYVRSAFGFEFGNSKSPRMLRKVRSSHPELKDIIKIEGEE